MDERLNVYGSGGELVYSKASEEKEDVLVILSYIDGSVTIYEKGTLDPSLLSSEEEMNKFLRIFGVDPTQCAWAWTKISNVKRIRIEKNIY